MPKDTTFTPLEEMNEHRLLNAKEAARALGIDYQYFLKLTKTTDKWPPTFQMTDASRSRRWRVSDLIRLRDENMRP